MRECQHGEPVGECAWCAAGGPVSDLPGPVVASGPATEAKFAGRCAHCDQGYGPGARIAHSPDAGGWALESHTVPPFEL